LPENKSDKKENQQNHDHFAEEAITLNKKKVSEYPPNLNDINKNLV
jgi:hypothetical protein